MRMRTALVVLFEMILFILRFILAMSSWHYGRICDIIDQPLTAVCMASSAVPPCDAGHYYTQH